MRNLTTIFAIMKNNAHKFCRPLNTLGLCVNNIILLFAFYYQLVLHELPCPICLLQRVGIIMISIGFLQNILFGIRNIHYGIALLGCIITIIIALRQVFIHILPGDPGYGSTLFGIHFYTWALLSSLLTMIGIALLLILQKENGDDVTTHFKLTIVLEKISITIFVLLIAANVISTILECGLGQCPSNPTGYQLLPK